MSQTKPLSKVLTQYNHVVETIHKRMQQDNMAHIDDSISLYAHALAGGASDASLGYMEKTMANRDNFIQYRTEMDATEWSKVDQKLHSYLGRNMNMLVGGDKRGQVPDTNLIQSNRLLNAYVQQLAQKMMQSRFSNALEFKKMAERLLVDPRLNEDARNTVSQLLALVEETYQPKLERDAQELAMLEHFVMSHLGGLSNCILRCGAQGEEPTYEVAVQRTPSGVLSASRSFSSSVSSSPAADSSSSSFLSGARLPVSSSSNAPRRGGLAARLSDSPPSMISTIAPSVVAPSLVSEPSDVSDVPSMVSSLSSMPSMPPSVVSSVSSMPAPSLVSSVSSSRVGGGPRSAPLPRRTYLQGGCGSGWGQGSSGIKGGCGSGWNQGSSSGIKGGETHESNPQKPKFQSPAAQQLYDLINS